MQVQIDTTNQADFVLALVPLNATELSRMDAALASVRDSLAHNKVMHETVETLRLKIRSAWLELDEIERQLPNTFGGRRTQRREGPA